MYSGELTEAVIGCAYAVANALGSGFLEKVYETLLRMNSERRGFRLSSNGQYRFITME